MCLQGHTSVVEDVAWHAHHRNIFGSVGDDFRLVLWDTRQDPETPMHTRNDAHSSFLNCLSFSPMNEYLLVTGSADHTVALWDMRNLKKSLHTFQGHRCVKASSFPIPRYAVPLGRRKRVHPLYWSTHSCASYGPC